MAPITRAKRRRTRYYCCHWKCWNARSIASSLPEQPVQVASSRALWAGKFYTSSSVTPLAKNPAEAQPTRGSAMGVTMRWGGLLILMATGAAGCASGQLNYNTLDLASTTDYLLTAQIIENLARFIDSDAAVPAQVVMNGGTTTTANTISPQLTYPLSKALTVGTTTVAAATTTSAVTAAKSLSINASNVSTQNWAFEPVTDTDQLRRLYDLYRFAVAGNNDNDAQSQLLSDYPLPYRTPSGGGPPTIDKSALTGPNCIVCDAGPPPTKGNCNRRPELPTTMCVGLNSRLLPGKGAHSPWLLWTNLTGTRLRDQGRQPSADDLYIGARGDYSLYVDKHQAEKFAEFALLIAAAASSAPNVSSGASSGGNGPKPKGAVATPNSILLNQ